MSRLVLILSLCVLLGLCSHVLATHNRAHIEEEAEFEEFEAPALGRGQRGPLRGPSRTHQSHGQQASEVFDKEKLNSLMNSFMSLMVKGKSPETQRQLMAKVQNVIKSVGPIMKQFQTVASQRKGPQ